MFGHQSDQRRAARAARAGAVGLLLLLTVGLVGCSSDDGGDESSDAEPATRTVEDAFGPTDIPADPQRVIADSVSTYAHLESLGITPIAVALPEGISAEYISEDAGEMTNVVASDGWTIDVEQALALEPDLIVGVGAEYNEEYCTDYRAAVATFCFTEVYESGTDQDMIDTVNGLAVGLGREAEAEEGIAAYQERLAELTERVDAAGLDDQSVGVVRFDSAGFIGVRIDHAPNAILEALGFAVPDFPEETVDGYLELSEENLSVLDEADILVVNTDDDVVVDELSVLDSPLWNQLEVVEAEQDHFVGAWNGGDLPQLQRILDDIETSIIEPAEARSA